MNGGVNQRGTTISTMAAMPSARTLATRSVQASRDGSGSMAVQHTASELMRSGALAASHRPIMPPMETPQ
jgi:hypothetical protein